MTWRDRRDLALIQAAPTYGSPDPDGAPMTAALPTITECDLRLRVLTVRYRHAVAALDGEEAQRTYKLLDQTLELRGRLRRP